MNAPHCYCLSRFTATTVAPVITYVNANMATRDVNVPKVNKATCYMQISGYNR
jgi:hypothetical protein